MPGANSELIEKIKGLSDEAIRDTDVEIAEVQLRGAGSARLLRLYIDKPGGVTHGDCEMVSERVGRLIDEQDIMPDDSYTLEVSSLGSERKFREPRDYQRVIGQKLAITLRNPVAGTNRIEGKLLQVHDQAIDVELTPGERFDIPLDQVVKAKLKFEP